MASSAARRVGFGPYLLDRADASLWHAEERVAIPPKAYALLDLLVLRAGQLVHKDEILQRVWWDATVGDAVVKVCVAQLRQALGDEARSPRFVATEARRGYRFICPLREATDREPLDAVLQDGIAGDAEGAVARAVRAARQAEVESDHPGAAEHLARALALARFLCPERTSVLRDLGIRLGQAWHRAGQPERARPLLTLEVQAARELADPVLLARAALALGEGHVSTTQVDRELIEALEDALASLRECQAEHVVPEWIPRLEARLAHAWVPDPEATGRRRALAHSALRGVSGPPEHVAWILRHALWACFGPDDALDFRREQSDRALVLAEAAGSLDTRLHALGLRISFALEAADLAQVDRDLAAYLSLARDSRRPWFEWAALRMRVLRGLLAGEFEQVEALLGENIAKAGSLEHPEVVGLFYAQLTAARMLQGRGGEVEHFLTSLAEPGSGHVGWRCALAWVQAELGRRAEVRSLLRELTRDELRLLPRDGFWTGCMSLLADACASVGDRRLAARLYQRLEPFADQCAVMHGIAWFGSLRRPLGRLARLLGDDDAARTHFDEALRVHRRMGATPWLERTRADASGSV